MIQLSPQQRNCLAALAVAPLIKSRGIYHREGGSDAKFATPTVESLRDRGLCRTNQKRLGHWTAVITRNGEAVIREAAAITDAFSDASDDGYCSADPGEPWAR